MNKELLAKQSIRQHLAGCNFEMAKALLTKQFSGSVIPNELASLLHAFSSKPEADTAINFILFDQKFLSVFELCRAGGITEKLFREGDIEIKQ